MRGDFNMLHIKLYELIPANSQGLLSLELSCGPLEKSSHHLDIKKSAENMSFHSYLGRICAFPFFGGGWGEDSEKHEDLQVPLKSIKNKLLLTPPPSKVNYKHRHKRSSVDITSKCPQLCRFSNKTVFPRPTYF